MSNSPLVSFTKISPFKGAGRSLWVGGQLKTFDIDRITPHCVVGQCSIEALGAEFVKTGKNASSNYGIGKDGRVGMYVEEKDRSWCSSSSANDVRAVTIECASDTFKPYAFTQEAYNSLVALCIDICRRNGKSKLLWFGDKNTTLNYQPAPDEMILTVHRWFATDGRSCPGDWMYSRMSALANSVTAALTPGTNPTEEDNDVITYDQFVDMWTKLRRELQDNDSSPWSEEARKWAVDTGLVQGGSTLPDGTNPNYMWEDLLTREQMVTILFRFMQMIEKKMK